MDTETHRPENGSHERRDSGGSSNYWRFGAMILTAMIVMYATTYVNTFQLSHIQWSETRLFMTFLMGATMAVIMLAFMLGMYRNWKVNVGIVLAAIAMFGLGTWLVRSQTTVQDDSYMSAMIPHHSIAILTSERSDLHDLRVCELAVGIIEAQRREIAEMEWLIGDIGANGPAATASDAESRSVPVFTGKASRTCT